MLLRIGHHLRLSIGILGLAFGNKERGRGRFSVAPGTEKPLGGVLVLGDYMGGLNWGVSAKGPGGPRYEDR